MFVFLVVSVSDSSLSAIGRHLVTFWAYVRLLCVFISQWLVAWACWRTFCFTNRRNYAHFSLFHSECVLCSNASTCPTPSARCVSVLENTSCPCPSCDQTRPELHLLWNLCQDFPILRTDFSTTLFILKALLLHGFT